MSSSPQPSSALPLPPDALLVGAALMIDFDGTLVELAERPDAVIVDPPLQRLMVALAAAFPDRLAIVSGRSIEQIDGFFGPLAQAVSVFGSHGVERRIAGRAAERPDVPESLPLLAERLQAFVGGNPGALIERKTLGVALHYRQAPAIEAEARALTEALAAEFGVPVQHGKMMSELRAGSGDKGSALRHYMEDPARGGARPVFIGDDLTDEPAFVAARDLGGAGVLVGHRAETEALYALPGVNETRAWLAQAVGLA